MATIQKLPSGKFRAQVRKAGVYRAQTFDRRADANAWSVDIERAISGGGNTGTIRPTKDMTFGDVIDAYLEAVPTGETTRFNLVRIGKRIGGTKVVNLNAIIIGDFVQSRRDDGVAGATIASDLSALSSVLKWARHDRKLDINPALATEARAALSAAKIDVASKSRTRIPTQAELDQIIAYFEAAPRQVIPIGTIIRFAAASAMRLGEITRIRIEDISWNEKSVLIKERKDPKRKARNDQIVPLVGEAYQIAREAAAGRSEGRLFPYNSKSIGDAFGRVTRKLGIKDLHFHDLRHLAITELFRAGLPIQLVAVVSGHRDWKHLKRYTQLNAQDVHAALEGLK